MSCQHPNCNTTPLVLDPNPDISGVGVVLGFEAAAWVTFLSLIVSYFIAPIKPQEDNDLHSLDSIIRNRVQRLLGIPLLSQHAPIFENVVLVTSDQQLVTGLSIIISGYSQLRCGLSFYHWQMVISLAWFSTITHLATLPFLHKYRQKCIFIWYIRVLLMAGLGIMLAIGILPSGASFPTSLPPRQDSDLASSEELAADLPRPALCLFDFNNFSLAEGSRQINMIMSEILLVSGLCIRVNRIFSVSRNISKTYLADKPAQIWRRLLLWSCRRLETSPRWRQAVFLPMTVFSLAVLISLQCVLDFLASNICGILWLLFSLIWGTLRLSAIRRLVDGWHNNVLEENAWGFGQLVSVLLLLIPVFLLADTFFELTQRDQATTASSIPGEEALSSLGHANAGSTWQSSSSSRQITLDNAHIAPPRRNRSCSVFASLTDLCGHDYRRELWYQEDLFLVVTAFIGGAIGVLPAAQWWGTSYSWTELLQRLQATIAVVFIVCLVSLCGILDSLDSNELTERHPISIIRLVIDPGWRYRVVRWIYIVLFQVVLPALLAFPYRVTVA